MKTLNTSKCPRCGRYNTSEDWVIVCLCGKTYDTLAPEQWAKKGTPKK